MSYFSWYILVVLFVCEISGAPVAEEGRFLAYKHPSKWLLHEPGSNETTLYHVQFANASTFLTGLHHWHTDGLLVDVLQHPVVEEELCLLTTTSLACVVLTNSTVSSSSLQPTFYSPDNDMAIMTRHQNIIVWKPLQMSLECFQRQLDTSNHQFELVLRSEVNISGSIAFMLTGTFVKSNLASTNDNQIVLVDADLQQLYLAIYSGDQLQLDMYSQSLPAGTQAMQSAHVFQNEHLFDQIVFLAGSSLYFYALTVSVQSDFRIVLQDSMHIPALLHDSELVNLFSQYHPAQFHARTNNFMADTADIVTSRSELLAPLCSFEPTVLLELQDPSGNFKLTDPLSTLENRLPISLYDDQDKDGILTKHELSTLAEYGNSPLRQDINLEVDFMSGRQPRTESLMIVIESFTERGIHLYIHVDEEVPFVESLQELGVFDWDRDFIIPYKETYHSMPHGMFHYCMFINAYGVSSSSGKARLYGNDFLVSLGKWPDHGNVKQQAGTLLHELGHNLGLLHGGEADATNYKANHFSVMNYLYQLDGIQKAGSSHGTFAYSYFSCDDLDEDALKEERGIHCSPDDQYVVKLRKRSLSATTNTDFDFNNDGVISQSDVAYDLTGDGTLSTLKGSRNVYRDLYFYGLDDVPDTTEPGMTIGKATTSASEGHMRHRQPFPFPEEPELAFSDL